MTPPLSRVLTGVFAIGLGALTLPACGQPDQPSLRLASAPMHLILIEEDGADAAGHAVVEALDPRVEAWSPSTADILIEDAPEDDGLADAEDLGVRTRRFLLALAGSAGAVELGAAATSADPAGWSSPLSARPEVSHVRASSREDAPAALATPATEGLAAVGPQPRLASLEGMSRTAVRTARAREPGEIRETNVHQLPRVRASYERTLKAEPTLRGRLLLAMKVLPSGEVADARISEDGVGSAALSTCVENAVSSWSFPPGTETVAVEYPVTLKPGHGGW